MRVFVNGKKYEQELLMPMFVRDDGEAQYFGLPLDRINTELLQAMEFAFTAENKVDIASCHNKSIGMVMFLDGKTAMELSACDIPDNCLVCDKNLYMEDDEKAALRLMFGSEDCDFICEPLNVIVHKEIDKDNPSVANVKIEPLDYNSMHMGMLEDIIWDVFEKLNIAQPDVCVAYNDYFDTPTTVCQYDIDDSCMVLNKDYIGNPEVITFSAMMTMYHYKYNSDFEKCFEEAIKYAKKRFPSLVSDDLKSMMQNATVY